MTVSVQLSIRFATFQLDSSAPGNFSALFFWEAMPQTSETGRGFPHSCGHRASPCPACITSGVANKGATSPTWICSGIRCHPPGQVLGQATGSLPSLWEQDKPQQRKKCISRTSGSRGSVCFVFIHPAYPIPPCNPLLFTSLLAAIFWGGKARAHPLHMPDPAGKSWCARCICDP